MAEYVDWSVNGTTYRYWFLAGSSNASNIKAEAGNYIFVKPTANGWIALYVGIADDLSDRIPGHERWAEAVAQGATWVVAHVQPDSAKRKAEEKVLIGALNPPLNTQHRRRATLLGG